MERTLWTAALAFAAGIGVGASIRGCGDDPPAANPMNGNAAGASAGPARETSSRPRAVARPVVDDPEGGAPTPSAPPAPDGRAADVREIPFAGAATGFHEMEVVVVEAEGAPRDRCMVYALPAGAQGTNRPEFLSYNDDDDGEWGRFRLRLPSPGAFDIYARTEHVLARAEDVAVPGATTLRLALPRTPVAVFVLDPQSPPGGDVTFQVWAVPADDKRYYPGRNERHSGSSSSDHTVGTVRPRLELPLSPVEFEVAQYVTVPKPDGSSERRVPERPVVFEPRRFVPPATIRVRAFDPSERTLDVALTLAEPSPAANADREVALRLEFDGDAVERSGWLLWNRRQGERLDLRHPVRTPTGILRWSGSSVVPGAARWDLDRAPRLEATVEVLSPSSAEGVTVLVNLPPEEAQDEGRVVVRFPNLEDPESTDRALVPVGKEVVLDVPGEWLLVVVEDPDGSPTQRRVAGPVRVRPGGRAVLKPRPGGYIVFAPRDAPPERAGAIVVARSDGAPFDYGEDFGCVAPLDAGAILGPFEPGVVSLDVRVGSVPWGRYEVTVRENSWTTFVPRSFR